MQLQRWELKYLIPEELALQIVRVWLTTDFEGGRHAARIAQLDL